MREVKLRTGLPAEVTADQDYRAASSGEGDRRVSRGWSTPVGLSLVLSLIGALVFSGRADAGTSASEVVAPQQAVRVTAAGKPVVDWASVVRTENARPGTPARIGVSLGTAPGLDAFADRVSVLPGETVGLYISAAGHVRISALRIGFYGGVGMRSVWHTTATATRQRGATTYNGSISGSGGAHNTRMVVAGWRRTLNVPTAGWPEGAYVFRIDTATAARYVLLTVRSATTAGRLLVVNAPMTWQAYNTWGGRGLYGDVAKRFSQRSLAVSFDRPYSDGFGAGRFFGYDAQVLQTAERLGLPLAWATDYDLATNPGLVTHAVGVVFGGHVEYWTAAMRDTVVQAIAHGVNVAYFGANTAYWRVRLVGASQPATPRADGRPRVMFGSKSARLDPLAGKDPSGATARFRDGPHARLEEQLTGMRYDCFPAEAAWVVADPTWWGYAGTGLRRGDRIPGAVGPESDRVYPSPRRPHPLQVVAYTTLPCRGHTTMQTGVYWTTARGAGVFNAGTIRWSARLYGFGRMSRLLARITANVLIAFARPRAGTAHRATDNVSHFLLPPSSTTTAT